MGASGTEISWERSGEIRKLVNDGKPKLQEDMGGKINGTEIGDIICRLWALPFPV